MNGILHFLGAVCGSLAILLMLTLLFESKFCKERQRLSSAKYLCTVAMCSALSALLMLVEFPLPFLAPGFYKLDLSELPVMICGFYLGPSAGILTEFLKVMLKLLLKGTTTAYVGDFANFIIGCMLVMPASMIYHRRKAKKNAIIGLCVGSFVMSLFGSFLNAVYLLPAFAELFMPMEAIIEAGSTINSAINNVSTFVLFAVLPLNLIKGTMVSVLTLLLYKRTERILFKRS